MTAHERDLAALEHSLRRRFRVVETTVRIASRAIRILHPASAEELIDERAFEHDERLPYWAELWPSARVLSARLLAKRGDGRSLLELGCGAGLAATCASLAGFAVTASDYYEDAVRFARVNAWRNGAPLRDALVLDWRALPPTLPRADVVVASDVLYERPYGALVARVLGSTLAEGGTALLADPGRVAREDFLNTLPEHGLRVSGYEDRRISEGTVRQTIRVFSIRRAAARERARMP